MVAPHQALRGHRDLPGHRARVLERAPRDLAELHSTARLLAQLDSANGHATASPHRVGGAIAEPGRYPAVDPADRGARSQRLAAGPRIPQPYLARHAPLKSVELGPGHHPAGLVRQPPVLAREPPGGTGWGWTRGCHRNSAR